VHIDPAADLRQLVDELFLDMKFNSFSSQGHVRPIVYGPADRPIGPLTSCHHPKTVLPVKTVMTPPRSQ